MHRLLIINPNSDTRVSDGIDRAVAPWRRLGLRIDCVTNAAGPLTISSDEDVARTGADVGRIARAEAADAVLVACFSDPGVEALRMESPVPVFGIQECGLLTAMAMAPKFGIIALSDRAVPRHLARVERMQIHTRCVGDIGLSGWSALAVGQSDAAFAESIAAGTRLRDLGAGAVVLGCAGFGPRRAALEKALGLAVIDPVLAGVAMASGVLLAG